MIHKEYRQKANGADTAVLFIHGIVGTPNHFIPFYHLVPNNVSLYSILLDGHGKDPKDFSNTSMKKWESQVRGIIDELCETHDNIYIIAHSLGTLLATEQAICNKKIKGLFFLSMPITVFVKPSMIPTALSVCLGKPNPNNKSAISAANCYGIEPNRNLFLYLKWIPRFIELLFKVKSTRKILSNLETPCVSYQCLLDEVVSPRSIKYLTKKSNITVKALPDSSHYYYGDEDMNTLLKDIKRFMEFEQ
ncbi:MAG: hypothetical protein IJA52_00910 [Clostridia bacterium]|nr:hypothetical protein [Clostridia bacterium]